MYDFKYRIDDDDFSSIGNLAQDLFETINALHWKYMSWEHGRDRNTGDIGVDISFRPRDSDKAEILWVICHDEEARLELTNWLDYTFTKDTKSDASLMEVHYQLKEMAKRNLGDALWSCLSSTTGEEESYNTYPISRTMKVRETYNEDQLILIEIGPSTLIPEEADDA